MVPITHFSCAAGAKGGANLRSSQSRRQRRMGQTEGQSMSVPPENYTGIPKPALVVDPGHVSLRDYFAASIIQGMIATGDHDLFKYIEMAERAYEQADAMLKAREANHT
jgi:hypothetical protein